MKKIKDLIEARKIKIDIDQDIVNKIKSLKFSESIPEDQVKYKIAEKILESFEQYKDCVFHNEDKVDIKIKKDNKTIAIFEIKRPDNREEMITEEDFNRKALHELIVNFAYIFRKNDQEINRGPYLLYITNGSKWFVFTYQPFIEFIYDKWTENRIDFLGKNKNIFYEEKNKEELYKTISEILKEREDLLENFKKNCYYVTAPEEIALSVHPVLVLNEKPVYNVNELNKKFYDELLYIFGLKEIEENGKKTIKPLKKALEIIKNEKEEKENKKDNTSNESNESKSIIESLNVDNTFYEQIFSKVQNFEETIELIIIWLNRILFLKLFEARLVAFNNNDVAFKFFNFTNIPNTARLENLFFDVLAKKEKERANKLFKNVPYLNSSLFEKQKIEDKFPISKIDGDLPITYSPSTVIRDENMMQKKKETKLLDYLFEFLNSYSFDEKGDPSSIINPVVLGLVFEKINGYKDGSYYTPNSITDFMTKEAIEQAILNKVREKLNNDYSDFNEFKHRFNYFEGKERNAIKEIIRNLTILDPAVGSGHFLVSALNFMLQTWFDFGLIDVPPKYELKYENGDIKLYKNSMPFLYIRNSPDPDDLKFQKAIFNAKKDENKRKDE